MIQKKKKIIADIINEEQTTAEDKIEKLKQSPEYKNIMQEAKKEILTPAFIEKAI